MLDSSHIFTDQFHCDDGNRRRNDMNFRGVQIASSSPHGSANFLLNPSRLPVRTATHGILTTLHVHLWHTKPPFFILSFASYHPFHSCLLAWTRFSYPDFQETLLMFLMGYYHIYQKIGRPKHEQTPPLLTPTFHDAYYLRWLFQTFATWTQFTPSPGSTGTMRKARSGQSGRGTRDINFTTWKHADPF